MTCTGKNAPNKVTTKLRVMFLLSVRRLIGTDDAFKFKSNTDSDYLTVKPLFIIYRHAIDLLQIIHNNYACVSSVN